MVYYGAGLRGDVTISANTTENEQYLSYQNLTINAGVTFTVPNQSIIEVEGTLTVEGVLSVKPRAGSGGSGGGAYGGDAGGTVFIRAQSVAGSGTIRANGTAGESNAGTNERGGQSTGLPHTVIAASNLSGDPTPTGGRFRNNGIAVASAIQNNVYALWVENWLLPSEVVSEMPSYFLLSAGGGGAYGGTYADQDQSGAGGAGGSFGNLGGNGGDGAEDPGTYRYGGSGGGGGGAGGHIIIFTDSLSSTLTFESKGGNGGDGHNASGTADGGGGGGGSGGIITAFADIAPQSTTLTGGSGGIGNGSGADGAAGLTGIVYYYPITRL